MLTSGIHQLKVVRSALSGRETEFPKAVIVRDLSGQLGDLAILDGLECLARLQKLECFISGGVMAASQMQQLYGGFVFLGPGTVSSSRRQFGGMKFTTLFYNDSSAEATFRFSAGGVETRFIVSSGEEKPLSLSIPPGEKRITLAVDGDKEGLFFWGAPFLEPAEPKEMVPIILITLDTTRRDVIGPYTAEEGDTPALDRFAAQATVYTRAYATSPWTLPSHGSIFTGLYPSRHGAGVSSISLDDRLPTLAEYLSEKGYYTGGFAGGPLTSARRGLGQGFCFYRDPDPGPPSARRLTEGAISFLEQHQQKPIFLFVNYFDPHAPYAAPAPFRDLAGAGRFDSAALNSRFQDKIVVGGDH